MKHLLLITCSLLFCNSLISQISYEPGYYLDKSNNKIEGYVKNIEWLSNPDKFSFKKSLASEPSSYGVDDVNGFGVTNGQVFIKATVDIDISTGNLNRLTGDKQPNFKERTLFLRKIIEGEASLYKYLEGNVRCFFYSTEEQKLTQLVFKKYLTSSGALAVNEMYKQQLSNNLNCSDLKLSNFKNLKFKEQSLQNFIIKYNECQGSEYTKYRSESISSENESKFNLRAKAGVRFNAVSFSLGNRDFDLENKIGPQLGVEGEFIFKFNRNKWSTILGLDYFSYNDEQERSIGTLILTQTFIVDYSAIEISPGVRHSFFTGDDSRLFVNLQYVLPFNISSSIRSSVISRDLVQFEDSGSFAYGLGYEYKSFALEVKLQSPRDILSGRKSRYKNFAVTFGYSFL